MKNSIVACLLISILLVSIGACKKNFFDATTQDGSISDATAYKVKADFDAGVIGAYVPLQTAFDNWMKLPGFISNDVTNGEGNAVGFDRLFDNSYSVTTDYWRSLYKIVSNTNIVIQKLDDVGAGVLTDEQKALAYGQVKFLRGFAYLALTQAFGDVPMPLKSYSSTQNNMSCATQDEVLNQVIADLNVASQNLPEAKEWVAADIGRVGKGAAYAYLSLAYMYKKDWDNAKIATEKLLLLTKPAYKLLPSVRTVFSSRNRNLDESVFEIQFNPGSSDKWIAWGSNDPAPSNGHTIATQTAPPGIGESWCAFGGWGNWCISPKALASFEPGDDRRKELIVKYPESYKGELMSDSFNLAGWDGGATAFPANKKMFGYSTKYWFGVTRLPAGDNIIVMRFPEVLLNYAEILFNKNQAAAAYQQINLVRTRARLPIKTTSSDSEKFMTDLMNERRHEMMLEANLWWHYTRTGRAVKFLKEEYNIDMLPKWSHLPTPSRERDVNPSLCTNGY